MESSIPTRVEVHLLRKYIDGTPGDGRYVRAEVMDLCCLEVNELLGDGITRQLTGGKSRDYAIGVVLRYLNGLGIKEFNIDDISYGFVDSIPFPCEDKKINFNL